MFDRKKFLEDGLIKLPGALLDVSEFREFIIDLVWTGESVLANRRVDREGNLPLDEASERLSDILIKLRDTNGKGRLFGALFSQPGKLLSLSYLRQHPVLIEPIKHIFGSKSVIAFPQMSDALTTFFNIRDNTGKLDQSLPVHQDYPYMMQSSSQLVIWIPLIKHHPQTGSIEFWRGSQSKGIAKQVVHGEYYEVAPDEVQKYELETGNSSELLEWELGDIIIFNSNLFHRTIPNVSDDHVRAIQVFRASDLNEGDGLDYAWRSTRYVDGNSTNPKHADFKSIHQEFVESE